MPTGRARFHLVEAGRSSGTPTHTHSQLSRPHASPSHTLVISSSPLSSSASSPASRNLWCCSKRLQEGGDPAQLGARTQEEERRRKDECRYCLSSPLRGAQMWPLSVSSVVAFFALSYVSVCSHAPTPPPSFHHTLSLALSPSLSAEAANQAPAEDRDFVCDEWREDKRSASSSSPHSSAPCPPPQPRSL